MFSLSFIVGVYDDKFNLKHYYKIFFLISIITFSLFYSNIITIK